MNNLINFLGRHFELIMAVNIAILAYYILILISLKLSDQLFRNYIRGVFKSALYIMIFVIQLFLVVLLIYLYWYNYGKSTEKLLTLENIEFNTSWVKSQQKIYFIDKQNFLSVQVNGEGKEYIFEGDYPIREYHISPDGKRILIVSSHDLNLLDLETRKAALVDTLMIKQQGDELKGVISGIRWARNSTKFVYEISRWSSFSSQDDVYIYYIDGAKKVTIQSPIRRISRLYWDVQGENLYFLKHETEDQAKVLRVKVIKIPLQTLEPVLVFEIPYQESTLPLTALELRGIDLFVKSEILSFGRISENEERVSQDGRQLGIDEDDNLYVINEKWFKQRLFKVQRQPNKGQEALKHFQYKGGELIIKNIRWLPDGRYVVMEQVDVGLLVLDPFNNKIGQLLDKSGSGFGWYVDINDYRFENEINVIEPKSDKRNQKRSLSFIPR